MRCKNCQYSLEGLTGHRCPECGTPFDPNAKPDPITRRDKMSVLVVLAIIVTIVALRAVLMFLLFLFLWLLDLFGIHVPIG